MEEIEAMSDYPNGPYHFFSNHRPTFAVVCEVFNSSIEFVGDEHTYRLDKMLKEGKLVRLVEVEQATEPHQPVLDTIDAINKHNGVPGWRPGEEYGAQAGAGEKEGSE